MEQAGELFCAMRDYNQQKPIQLTGLMKAIFTSFKNQFDRDLDKYKSVSDRNKDNGSKGGRPEKNPEKPTGLIGLKNKPTITQHNPNKPDSDNDSDSVNDSVNGNGIDKEKVSKNIIKVIDIEQRKLAFAESLKEFELIYGSDMIEDFFFYWSEELQNGKKMRWEDQRSWNITGRLRTWKKNERPKQNFQQKIFNQQKPDKMQILQNEYQIAMNLINNQEQ
jgi:hypothetical protein